MVKSTITSSSVASGSLSSTRIPLNERRKAHALKVFQAIDSEGTGKISKQDFVAYIRPEKFEKVKLKIISPQSFIDDLLAKVDWKTDGCIDLAGWLDLCTDLG